MPKQGGVRQAGFQPDWFLMVLPALMQLRPDAVDRFKPQTPGNPPDGERRLLPWQHLHTGAPPRVPWGALPGCWLGTGWAMAWRGSRGPAGEGLSGAVPAIGNAAGPGILPVALAVLVRAPDIALFSAFLALRAPDCNGWARGRVSGQGCEWEGGSLNVPAPVPSEAGARRGHSLWERIPFRFKRLVAALRVRA